MTISCKLGQSKRPSPELDAAHAETAIMLVQSETEKSVDRAYWLRRRVEELALAGSTVCEKARLIHLELAARYSVKAG